ncbi:acyltransferase family protein [Rathayibacter caricis]|nr:acyltransferase [Rathayibacter caricis]
MSANASAPAVTRTRVTAFDVARGFAIIGMVCGHSIVGLEATGRDLPEAYQVANDVFHTFRMPLFFLLAGVFLIHTMKRFSYGGWVADKAQFLLYPYAVWALLRGAVELGALQVGVGEDLSPTDVLVGLVWDPRAWYLPALFLAFAVVGGAYALLHRFAWWGAVAAALVGGLVLLSDIDGWPPLLEVHPFTLYMLLGVLASRQLVRATSLSRRIAAVVAAGAAAVFTVVVFLLYPTGVLADDLSVPFVLASVPGVVMLIALGRAVDTTRAGRVLQKFGSWSLTIYVAHGIPLSLTRALLDRAGVDSLPVHIIAGTAAGVLLPAALAYLMERYGFARWLITMPGYRRSRTQRLP